MDPVPNSIKDEQSVAIGGTQQLRDVSTNEILLVPEPSSDPADPLLWPKKFKIYVAILTCTTQFMGNFVIGGPAIALVEQAMQYSGGDLQSLPYWIGQTGYLTTVATLMAGMSNFFWIPITTKYGRRPVYVISYIIFIGASIWCGCAKSWGVELAGRFFIGASVGAAEGVAPLTIADIFFLHERGFWMSVYFMALTTGVGLGIMLSGFIVKDHGWQYIYWITLAINGAIGILIVFTFPETYFARAAGLSNNEPPHAEGQEKASDSTVAKAYVVGEEVENATGHAPRRKVPFGDIRVFRGSLTSEPFWRILYRPFILLIIPTVLWTTAVLAINVGQVIIISTTAAPAFGQLYGFQPYQIGLTFLASVAGALLSMGTSHWLSDSLADYFTVRHKGVREAEFRLPALLVGTVISVVGIMLYGAGFQNRWHWMVPTLGIGLQSYGMIIASNAAMLYMVESYRTIAGEVIVTGMGYKAAFAFLLSFYVNPWIAKDGYIKVMATLAAITVGMQLLAVPLFFYGKGLRNWVRRSAIMSLIKWADDRGVGE